MLQRKQLVSIYSRIYVHMPLHTFIILNVQAFLRSQAWWIVDLHQWLSVTADVCRIHSMQDNFPRGDAGALSHSASVSTVLLDWEIHKYLMSPPASTALKIQHCVRHKLCSSLRTSLLGIDCDQQCQKQNTRAMLRICANNSYFTQKPEKFMVSAAEQGLKNKALGLQLHCV